MDQLKLSKNLFKTFVVEMIHVFFYCTMEYGPSKDLYRNETLSDQYHRTFLSFFCAELMNGSTGTVCNRIGKSLFGVCR